MQVVPTKIIGTEAAIPAVPTATALLGEDIYHIAKHYIARSFITAI